MAERSHSSYGTHPLVLFACFVIAVAGMKTASGLIVPFLLAVFIAVICSSPLTWLRNTRVPAALAFLIVLIVAMIAIAIIVAIIGSSVSSFTGKLPEYQALFSDKVAALVGWLQNHHIKVPTTVVSDYFDPGSVMQLVSQLMISLSGVLTNAVMILVVVLLILIEAAGLPRKVNAAFAEPGDMLSSMRDAVSTINNYLAIKTLFSVLTGVCIALLLWVLGVDFPLLWGLLVCLLNYIPNIGSIIAAVPPVLLALMQLGIWQAAVAACGFFVVNFAFGNVLEPRMMGRRLGLSMLVIFVSLVFWGWVLGAVGMFLSVPLTMVVKIALEHNERTRPIAILIGSAPAEPKPVR